MHPFSSTFADSTSVQDIKYNRVWDNAVSFLETSSLEKKEDIQGRIRQLIINLYKVPQKNPCSIWMFQTQNCLVSQADVHIYRALVTEHWLQKHIQAHSGEKKRKWKYEKEFWERGGNDQSKLVSFWVFPRWGCPVSLWVRGRAVALCFWICEILQMHQLLHRDPHPAHTLNHQNSVCWSFCY